MMETMWDRIANPTCLYLDYLEYKAACARNGDLPGARRHLAAAERSAVVWRDTAWEAALAEAQARWPRPTAIAARRGPGCSGPPGSSSGLASRWTLPGAGGR